MAKKKDGVPLFELMSRARSAPARPERSRREVSEKPEETFSAQEDQPDLTHVESGESDEHPETIAPAGPMFETSGGRLRLSLNYVSASIVLGSLIVLLVVAFVIGRKTGSPEEVAVTPAQAPFGLQAGRKYLVVEMLPGDGPETKTKAAKIEAFLADRCIYVSPVVRNMGSDGIWTVLLCETYVEEGSEAATDVVDVLTGLSKKYYWNVVNAEGFVPRHSGTNKPQYAEVKKSDLE